MQSIFEKFLLCRNSGYLTINKAFKILDLSENVIQFSYPNQDFKIGKDIRLGLPEIIGFEDVLTDIFQGQQLNLSLEGIGRSRSKENLIYFDMYIMNDGENFQAGNQLIIICEDVTSRMNLEQTLSQRSNETSLLLDAWAESSQYLDKIIQYMGDALLVTNAAAIIKIVNKATNCLFGYSDSELIGKPLSLIIDESQLKNLLVHKNNLSATSPNNTTHVLCKTKAGKNIVVAFSCSIIESKLEEEQDIIYIGRDIKL